MKRYLNSLNGEFVIEVISIRVVAHPKMVQSVKPNIVYVSSFARTWLVVQGLVQALPNIEFVDETDGT